MNRLFQTAVQSLNVDDVYIYIYIFYLFKNTNNKQTKVLILLYKSECGVATMVRQTHQFLFLVLSWCDFLHLYFSRH